MKDRSHSSQVSFFSEEIVLRGELRMTIPLYLNGQFYGQIRSTSDLVIGDKAHIEAELVAGQVVLGGSFQGTMILRERLEITATGRFQGKLIQKTPRLVVTEGGLFAGEMLDEQGHPFIAQKMPPVALEETAAPAPSSESKGSAVSLYEIES
jgi:cytoskeletal protein CcmA (bactofilin family)